MIYVLHGDDEFSKRQFLDGLRREVGAPELLEANTTTLARAGLTPRHLQEACSMVPFMAERRLIIVEGLLGQFDVVRGDQQQGRAAPAKRALEEWHGLAEILALLPPTTTLVFLEGGIRGDNALLKEAASVAQVHRFPLLRDEALKGWIRQRVAGAGATITPQAVGRLAELVGGNLWTLSGEIEKLSLYCGEAPIDDEAVKSLVAHSREESIFRAVDAILAGRSSVAIQLISWLRQSGAEVSHIITMLARQLRLILLAQELVGQRVSGPELGQRLGLPQDFAVRITLEQARRHAPERVAAMYRRLLDTDMAIKRGDLAEALALETLVAELCQNASERAPRPTRSGSR